MKRGMIPLLVVSKDCKMCIVFIIDMPSQDNVNQEHDQC